MAHPSILVVEQRSETVRYRSHKNGTIDEESGKVMGSPIIEESRMAPIYGLDRPFYHVDVPDAVDAAVRKAKTRDGVVDLRPCDTLRL